MGNPSTPPLQKLHLLISAPYVASVSFYWSPTPMVSSYGMLQISTPSTSLSTYRQSVASSALLSCPVLAPLTMNKRFSSCSLALPLMLSSKSTPSPHIPSSTASQSPTQPPFKRQTVSSLCLPRTPLPLCTYSRLHLSSSPSSTSCLCHTPPTQPSHYQDVCSHTHRPLHRPRQSMQTSIPMLPQVLAQLRHPRRLWTRR